MFKTKFAFPFLSLVFLTALNWHCTKIDTTKIGNGLIPVVDNVTTFADTLSVIAANVDSTPFGKGCATVFPLEEKALGYIGNDPVFGTTKATIYTELKPDFFPFSFQGTNRTIDSIVLVLSFKSLWGDSSTPQTVSVNRLTDPFKPDSSTCSSYTFTTLLGSATYVPSRLKDSLKLGFGENTARQLRIKLSNSFGQSLLTQDTATFKNDSTFKRFLSGFAIVPGNTGNTLSFFQLADSNTKLAIYYKYKDASNKDTVAIAKFRFNQISANAVNIVRNRTGSELSRNVGTSQRDTAVYIQTSPGSYAELKIPALSGLSNRIIHRAELIMEEIYTASNFTAPDFLYLEIKDTGNTYKPVPCDFFLAGGQPDFSTFGGFKIRATDLSGRSISKYVFNISRYVQKIVTNGRTNYTLRLSAPNYITTPNTAYVDACGQGIVPLVYPLNQTALGRVKLGGGSNPNYRMRLRIIYSRI